MASRRYKRRKKRGGGFFLSLLTFLVIAGAIITSVTVFLKVAEIEVSGVTRYNENEIIETSGIKTGDNMFMLNKFEVADRILDKYPYIEEIKIRRRLPDKFTFEITERVAAGYVMSDGNRWLIDRNAYILEMLSPDKAVKVPKITGAEVMTPHVGAQLVVKNEECLPVLKEVLTALYTTKMYENIARVEIGKLYDINIIYGNRFLVELGDMTQLSKKIEMLRAVIAELSEFDKGTINVSAVKEARFRPNVHIDLSEKPIEAKPEKQEGEETDEEKKDDTGEEKENKEENKDKDKENDVKKEQDEKSE